jgi:hypothetical protein
VAGINPKKGNEEKVPKNLEVSYWIPRQYAMTVSFDRFRAAVAGTDEEDGVRRVLDALERGENLSPGYLPVLAYAASEHAPGAFLCSDEDHQVDSGEYGEFAVALTDNDAEDENI